MKWKLPIARMMIVAGMLAVAPLASAQDAPPDSARAREIVALVTKAAALLDRRGKAAFAEFRKPNSEWYHGATYLFVNDMKSTVLLNVAFPAREGMNTTDARDAEGKYFHREIIQVIETRGAGWVSYVFPKPGETRPTRKWVYVKKVVIDGVPGLVASGFYIR